MGDEPADGLPGTAVLLVRLTRRVEELEAAVGAVRPRHGNPVRVPRSLTAELARSGVSLSPDKSVLEIGFGNGQFAAWVATKTPEYVGTELDAVVGAELGERLPISAARVGQIEDQRLALGYGSVVDNQRGFERLVGVDAEHQAVALVVQLHQAAGRVDAEQLHESPDEVLVEANLRKAFEGRVLRLPDGQLLVDDTHLSHTAGGPDSC